MTLREDAWPSLGRERQVWVPSTAWEEDYGRGMPYHSSVPAKISQLTPSLDAETLLEARRAETDLQRLDAEMGHRVAEFAPVLLRSEAASSSRIENLSASARAIFTAELGALSSGNATQIVANTNAMTSALDLSRDLSVNSVRAMHEALMESEPRHTPGHWRNEAVWIGTRSDSPIGAAYVAPHHSQVPELMSDLMDCASRDDLPPLVGAAIVHAQFETIHPFTDGNGRTGRALAQSMLRHHGVTRNVAVPVSAGLLADLTGYHDALTAYQNGDPTPIVSAFSRASLRAVGNTRTLVSDIDQIRQQWDKRLHVRRDSNAWRLLDVVARRPVITAAAAAHELGIKPPNVYPPLVALTEAGILTSKHQHRFGPLWRSKEILAAVDAFADRAGRREL